MPDQDPRELTRRWFEEVWNQQRESAIDELLASDAVIHGLEPGAENARGPLAFKPFHRRFVQAFPNIRINVEDVLVERDKSACRFTCAATHTGFGPMLNFAPTGRPVQFTGMSIIIWR